MKQHTWHVECRFQPDPHRSPEKIQWVPAGTIKAPTLADALARLKKRLENGGLSTAGSKEGVLRIVRADDIAEVPWTREVSTTVNVTVSPTVLA